MPGAKHKVTPRLVLLTEYEQSNPIVVKILKLLDERLDTCRISNDEFDADVSLRGRIAELKALKKSILKTEK